MKLIRQRGRLGMYASLAGLGVLVVGMIASFQQQYLWVSLLAVLLGFLLSQLGSYNLRRWGRSPRPDQVLEQALKGFDDRYHLYAWTLPAPYVLLSPQGVYCFAIRDQTGEISVTGAQWRSKFTLGRLLLLFAQEGLGNPTSEALEYAERMDEWIKSELPDVTVRSQPVVVFINERARLSINDPLVPVLEAKGLKKWLRGPGKGESLKSTDYKALERLFDSRSGAE
jgi:hypothetical protein